MAAMAAAAAAADAGKSHILFVEGGAGLGKTELLRRAADDGPWASVGRSFGSPMESGLAFSYLSQGLEELGFTGFVETASERSGDERRVQLFTAVRGWLAERASTGPVLLALEDLHWADEDSLGLLSFLCRRPAAHAIGILATLRPWPNGAATIAAELAATGRAELLRLAPLSDEAARALYQARAPSARDAGQADVVVRLASGNPLLVVEAAEAPGPVADVSGATPQVIEAMRQALLLSSFGALAEDARTCAQAGAVLGSPFRIGLVEEVSGLDRDAADSGIGTLLAAGLLRAAGPGRATFRHDLVAEAVYADLDEARRRRMHERAWRALASRHEVSVATAHALPADLVGLADAVQVALQAGREALRAGAVSSAVPLFKTAEALSGATTDPSIAVDLAAALEASGRPDEALTACERALSAPNATTAVRLRAFAVSGRAAVLCGDVPRAAAATEAGLQLAAGTDPEAFEAFSVDEVFRIAGFGDLSNGLARLEDLRRQALSLGAQSTRELDGLEAYLAVEAGRAFDIAALQGAAMAQGNGSAPADTSSFWHPGAGLVLACGWLEQFELAESCYRLLLEREGTKEPVMADTALAFAFHHGLLRQGRLQEADEVLAKAAHASEAFSASGAGLDSHSLAVLALEAGRIDQATEYMRPFQFIADVAGQWMLTSWAALTSGRILHATGRIEEAVASFRVAAAAVEAGGALNPCVVPWAGPTTFAALHQLQEWDEMAAIVTKLDRASEDLPCRWPRAMAALGRALLADGTADYERADLAFEESLGLLRAVPLPLDVGRVGLAHGASLRRRGQRRQARLAATEAADLGASHGSALLAAQAHDELARLGARRSRGPSDGLTETEAKVAVLAARGASNAEIATSLTVSVRTIETHLSRVYTKLGLQSRRQLMVGFPDGDGLVPGEAGPA